MPWPRGGGPILWRGCSWSQSLRRKVWTDCGARRVALTVNVTETALRDAAIVDQRFGRKFIRSDTGTIETSFPISPSGAHAMNRLSASPKSQFKDGIARTRYALVISMRPRLLP